MVKPGLQSEEQRDVRHLRSRVVELHSSRRQAEAVEGNLNIASVSSQGSQGRGSSHVSVGAPSAGVGDVRPSYPVRSEASRSRRSHRSELQLQLEELEADFHLQQQLAEIQRQAEAAEVQRKAAEAEAEAQRKAAEAEAEAQRKAAEAEAEAQRRVAQAEAQRRAAEAERLEAELRRRHELEKARRRLRRASEASGSQVFILLWVFLQNIVVFFGGSLLAIYLKKTDIVNSEYLFNLPLQEIWIGGGGIIGGILILILSHSLDIKSHFCAIRCIQIIAIGVIGIFYKLQIYEWTQEYWAYGIYSIFFMQGLVECMSLILTPVYIMETVCDRDLDEPVAFLLLVTTKLPLYISSFSAQLLSVNRLFLTLGVGIFSGIFFLVFLFYVFLPKILQDGKENEKSEFVDYWHLQFEGEAGWLRPASSALGLCILAEMFGSHAYQFYGQWMLRLANSPLSPELLSSGVSFMTLLLALAFWNKERIPYFLMVSTAVAALCLFSSGILLHGLEASGNIIHFAPITVYIIFTIAYSAGLGSLKEIIAVLITPRNYRLNILTLTVVISILSHRMERAAIPTLIQWFHPFGVFWLYSGIVLIGLLYIAVAIIGQIGNKGVGIVPGQRTVEEFITQV